MIITEEDLFDTKWVMYKVIRNSKSKKYLKDDTYTINLLKDNRRFIEEKGSQLDFKLNGGKWSLEENILIAYHLNDSINRRFEIIDFHSERGFMTLRILHKKSIFSSYRSCDEFILKRKM